MNKIKTFAFCFLLGLQSISFASIGSVIDDTTITAKIKSQIALNTTVSVFKVDVSTNHGVVILSGAVNSDTQAITLVELAQATDGVTDVDTTHLQVRKSKQPVNDAFITAKIKGIFLQKKIVGANDLRKIEVETRNGVVYLKGNLESKKQAAAAIRIARNVQGVKSVDYNFKY